MRRRPAILLVLAPALAVLGGCGIGDTAPAPAGSPATGLRDPVRPADAVHVYFSSPLGLERVSRLGRPADSPQLALERLREGPDEAERARGLVTFVPRGAPAPTVTGQRRGTVDVLVPAGWGTGRTALRQLVCTVADAAGAADGLATGDVEVGLRRAPGGPTDTRRCVLTPGSPESTGSGAPTGTGSPAP
ncbi:hypothetical protein [Streptomyces kronopolitis]|uniref:hypothetical protein n=1 Tax=Streptomyces kronopolitis TaxID=1612435 RepID=UPI003D98B3E2